MTSHVGSLHEEAEQCGRRGWAALGREKEEGVSQEGHQVSLGKTMGPVKVGKQ